MIYRTRLLINTYKPRVRAGITGRKEKENSNNKNLGWYFSLLYFSWLKPTFKDPGKPLCIVKSAQNKLTLQVHFQKEEKTYFKEGKVTNKHQNWNVQKAHDVPVSLSVLEVSPKGLVPKEAPYAAPQVCFTSVWSGTPWWSVHLFAGHPLPVFSLCKDNLW